MKSMLPHRHRHCHSHRHRHSHSHRHRHRHRHHHPNESNSVNFVSLGILEQQRQPAAKYLTQFSVSSPCLAFRRQAGSHIIVINVQRRDHQFVPDLYLADPIKLIYGKILGQFFRIYYTKYEL
uniref:Uncharacterized protein n=1 Tax=Glossina pallidipes TaxID=7398 RepID=A0A1A9ZY86_GLOPL